MSKTLDPTIGNGKATNLGHEAPLGVADPGLIVQLGLMLFLASGLPLINPVSSYAAEQREPHLPTSSYVYTKDALPAHFETRFARTFDNTPADNPVTDSGVTLGRVLFYDTRLSASGTVSCGSCHKQEHAFADPRRFSVGHANGATERNSMSLVNLRFSKAGKFWDERAATLEEQVLIPIQSKVEMGQNLDLLVETLAKDDRYPPLFEQAFGDRTITAARLSKALAQFLRSLVSYRSKYDAGLASVKSEADDFANFTHEENFGKALFLDRCAICHREGRGRQSAFFSMFRSLNNGIDSESNLADVGNGDITLNPPDAGLFKPSDLRNVEFTAPYMHDGRFQTLEEVVEHYSSGVKRHPNVSGFVFRMHFRSDEKSALVAFLKTLSDDNFLHDPRFSDPWRRDSADKNVATTDEDKSALKSGPSPQLPVSPEGALSADERSQRLAQHRGLPLGEALHYLKSLDENGDQILNRQEAAPLAKLLLENGTPPRFDRRRFSGRDLRVARGEESAPVLMEYDADRDGVLTQAELPDAHRDIVPTADLNGDGKLSADEARKFETVERFFALRDNGRDQTRVSRLVESLKVNPERADEIRKSLQAGHDEHVKQRKKVEEDVLRELEATLGTESFVRFQELLLHKQQDRELEQSARRLTTASVLNQIFEFDANKYEQLDSSELETLAMSLEETPGGFGTNRPPLPSLHDFSERLLSHDRDHSGFLSTDEVPDRLLSLFRMSDANGDGHATWPEVENAVRRTGFQRFVSEGVYVGGGFVSAFSQSERLLDDLDLSPEIRKKTADVLQKLQQQTQTAVDQTVRTEYLKLRAASAEPGSASTDLPKTQPVTLPRAEYFDLKSKSSREYRIFVAGPAGNIPESGSPIIYLSDGNGNFPVVYAAANKQIRGSMACVVVGIGYPTDDPQEMRELRSVDLTPPTSPEWVKANSRQGTDMKTGGNEQFADFIETELKPIIERKFKVDRQRQTLFGHSFGGLFVLHVLFSRPETFQTYVAASPSIWWNDKSILKEEQQFLEKYRGQKMPARLLLTVGDLEQASPMVQSKAAAKGEKGPRPGRGTDAIKEMSERLSAAKLEGFAVQSRVFAEESHGSVVLPAASRGVRFALGDPPPPSGP